MIAPENLDLDALGDDLASRIDEARRLEEQFKHEEHGMRWSDYYAGRADGLANALSALEWPNEAHLRKCESHGLPAVSSTALLDALRKRVERAEDQILTAATKREKDHATIRYETVRDILSSFERRLESASNKLIDGNE